MAEKGRSIDNIGIERLFMPLKYDEVFINDCRSVAELRAGVQTVSECYHYNRFHLALGYNMPMEAYRTATVKAI